MIKVTTYYRLWCSNFDLHFVLFLGQNGVMVETVNTFLLDTVPDEDPVSREFYDKHTFTLTAQPHTLALHAILCEQGNSFIISGSFGVNSHIKLKKHFMI